MKTRQIVGSLVLASVLGSCSSSGDSAGSSTAAAVTAEPVSAETDPVPTTQSDTAASTTEPLVVESSAADGAVTCTVSGVRFTTDFQSCDIAIGVATPIVVELGKATASPGIEILIAGTCAAIQGQEEKTAGASSIELAKRLDAEGVCPGRVDLLVLDPNA